jgi:hypothetical protein
VGERVASSANPIADAAASIARPNAIPATAANPDLLPSLALVNANHAILGPGVSSINIVITRKGMKNSVITPTYIARHEDIVDCAWLWRDKPPITRYDILLFS